MGNKQSVKKGESSSGEQLHPQEKRRLTSFLEDKKGSAKFTYPETHELWKEILAPDLLDSYTGYIFKSNNGQRKSTIDLDEFISLYVNIIKGSSSEKSRAVSNVIGSYKNDAGGVAISYQRLCKYMSDLMESFFLGLNHTHDTCFKSWSQLKEPERVTIEKVINGVCQDLSHEEDEVSMDTFENWLHHCTLFNLLHSYVLGSMYNLSPEQESNMIPLVQLPTNKFNQKWNMLIDVSQVVYINSFLPSECKEVWRLLFSIDIHGESFSKFLACITNQGPVIVVVHTNNNHTFGGFISTNLCLSPKWTGTDSSFLFRLSPSVDIFPATGYNDHYVYFNSNQTTLPNGLGMGGQYEYWGLWIDSHFGIGQCSESCTTYKQYKMLDSKKEFHIKSLEVWGVGEPPPSDEELGLRPSGKSGRSALDQDPTSTQILEMAGREMHSKGLRESIFKRRGSSQSRRDSVGNSE